MRDFHYLSYSQEIIFGHAALTRMEEALNHIGLQRLMIFTEPALRERGHLTAVEHALRGRLAGGFDAVASRVMDAQLEELLPLAQASNIDAVVGLGGPAPIGMAKAVAFSLEKRLTGLGEGAPSPTSEPLIPSILIPTTYTGSEMTSTFSVVAAQEPARPAVTTYDPKIAAKLVVYDPELTTDLPPDLTAASGMNALAHCFEALYSITRHPLSSAAALSGLRRIAAALPACYRDGSDLAARSEMLAGAHLAGIAFAGVAMGLHHALCHVLGEVDGIPHGIADSLILPHAIRFNAEVASSELLPAAAALGISIDGQRPPVVMDMVAQRVADLAAEMQLPGRLRDVGVDKSQLRYLAERAFHDQTLQNNPRPVEQPGQLEALLQAAW